MPARFTKQPKASTGLPMNVILLGDPAAGKATQAGMLVKKFGLYDMDMGLELNKLRAKSLQVDGVLAKSTDKGNLAPTKIVHDIFRDIITSVPKDQGILFDGTPKMLNEAKLVIRLLKKYGRAMPVVLYITIPLEETVQRMHKRNGYDTGKFGKRVDDSVEALKNRARYYRRNVSAVVGYLESEFPYKKISGVGSKGDVQKRVLEAIKQ